MAEVIYGKHKKRLEWTEVRILQLEAELKELKARLPEFESVLMLLNDVNTLGRGLMEVRRVDPGSFFLRMP